MAATPVSAKTVRDFFKANPSKVTQGRWWKSINGRGQLNPDAVKAFNRAKRGREVYVPKVMDNKQVVLKGAKGKKVVVSTAALRALDGSAGKRGAISKATKEKYLASL
jgi:ribosomal protein L28